MESRAEVFLDKYKQLENIVKAEYRLKESDSAVGFLLRNKGFQNIKNELDLCRETRNLLAHNPKVKNSYAVEPSVEMINLLDDIIDKIENPLRAENVMTNKSELCYKSMEDSVREAMIKMHEKAYTHIPILEDGVLMGVFSENTVLSILIDEDFIGIENNLKFYDMKKYLSIKGNENESYRFVSKDTLVSDISILYREASHINDRIGMIFVTHSGKESEKIMGIITAWDIAAELEVI